MTKQIQHIVLFATLALLSFAIWKYFILKDDIIKDKPFTRGYAVTNIELKITNEKGEMSAKFISPSLIRYTGSPIVQIEKPEFWTYSQGIKRWLITAKNAEYNAKTNEVNLQKDLIAKALNSETATSFRANNLLVNLKTKIATTIDGISLKQQQLSMQGQIAKFDLHNELFEVNKNVKAVYKAIQ